MIAAPARFVAVPPNPAEPAGASRFAGVSAIPPWIVVTPAVVDRLYAVSDAAGPTANVPPKRKVSAAGEI